MRNPHLANDHLLTVLDDVRKASFERRLVRYSTLLATTSPAFAKLSSAGWTKTITKSRCLCLQMTKLCIEPCILTNCIWLFHTIFIIITENFLVARQLGMTIPSNATGFIYENFEEVSLCNLNESPAITQYL